MDRAPDSLEREISSQVDEILEELFEADARSLYTEVRRVMSVGASRARQVMIAAAIREIMDLIEKAAGFQHRPPDARHQIKKLEGAWRVAQQTDTGLSEAIDAFGGTLEDFFEHFHKSPSRKVLARETLKRFDPTLREISPVVQLQRVELWSDLRNYFNLVVHRRTFPSVEEFEERLAAFEQFLVRWLRPPTSTDQAAIDALIREGPPSV